MDDTAAPFPPHEALARLLPGYHLDPEPLHTTNMSQVYLAADTRLHHRKVAVKIIADYLAAHPVYRKRFLREIQLMAGLEHPNIMYVITASAEDDRLLFLVMPRADHDLRRLIDAGPLDLAKTADVIIQTAKALDFAHDRGVVHRDVKPGNILFGPDGHVYLGDFGVAKEHYGEDLTSTGETIGTRRFTAPEVFDARSGDAATTEPPTSARLLPCTPRERSGDVYSLGAVLYHCLTGKRPFDDIDDHAAVSAQQSFELVPVSELRDHLPPAVDDVVAKAMHRDPDERFATCGDLAAALTQALGLTGAGSALPILRDIQERLRTGAADRDDTAAFAAIAAPASREDTRFRLISALVAVLALALAIGVLLYQVFDPDEGAESAAGDGPAASGLSESAQLSEHDPPSPTVEPVTGDERVERYPVVGECIDDSDDYYVVSCDSELAYQRILKIVFNPEDPNPAQPEHNDAAWLACQSLGPDIAYLWWDSAADEDDRAWNPETDRIYWIMCYEYV
jgi:serine/threonine-protein kinase